MNRRKLFLLLAAVIFIGCDIAILTWYFTRKPEYKEPPLTFDGSSDQLQHTVIVPTLDTPIPEGKNAIWCASFQIAWNKLKTDVAKGPVQIKGAEEIAKRLNDSPVTEADLPEGSYYAAAGLVKDGIVERIKKEMAERFPAVSAPQFPSTYASTSDPLVLAAYGYVHTGLRFSVPFFDNPEPLRFDPPRTWDTLGSFGIMEKHAGTQRRLREQIGILFTASGRDPSRPMTFALDLCRDSPNQLVIAMLPSGISLADSLALLAKQSEGAMHGAADKLSINDTLLVPNMNWRIEHAYRELEGPDRKIGMKDGKDFYLGHVLQHVAFKLDRSGTELSSEFLLSGYKSEPRAFHFTSPFLIVLKKREAKNPFFVMWVDNAELLQKWGE